MKRRLMLVVLAALMLATFFGVPTTAQSTADPAIAFVATRKVGKKTFYDLTVMNADGSNQTVILSTQTWSGASEISDSSWSPDLDPLTSGYQGSLAVTTWGGGAPNGTAYDLWGIDVNVTPTGVQASNL